MIQNPISSLIIIMQHHNITWNDMCILSKHATLFREAILYFFLLKRSDGTIARVSTSAADLIFNCQQQNEFF